MKLSKRSLALVALLVRSLALVALLVATLLTGRTARAESHKTHPAKLINVTTDERLDEGTSVRRAIFVVQVDGLIYTLRGDRVRAHAKDIGAGLIIGDPVQVEVKKDNVYLLKPDGKFLKTTIVKRERTSTAQ